MANKKKHKCTECDFVAKNKGGLTRHINSKHPTSERAISYEPAPRKMAWGGALPTTNSNNQLVAQEFCNQVAKIYGVPSMGVNAMGGQPYLNKDGRLFLLHDLRKAKGAVQAIRADFLQMSTNLDEMAVVKTTIVFKDGHEVEGIGEASKHNVKLEAVKKTLNMMAETRSLNRAIWKEIAGDVWDRVAENLQRSQDLSEAEKAKVQEAGRVSYEEMNNEPSEPQAPQKTSPEQLQAQFRAFIEKCEDITTLIDMDEKLDESELYTDKFKKEMHGIISSKVSSLEQ